MHSRRTVLLLLWTFLPVVGCSRQPRLSPDVVLHKATIASQGLLSARFAVAGTLKTGDEKSSIETRVQLQGRLQDGGKQVDVHLSFTGAMLPGEGQGFSGGARAIVAGAHEVFLIVHNLDAHGMPIPFVFPVSMLNVWLRLPTSSPAAVGDAVTPNPDLLAMQSAVVEVVNDRSFTMLYGRKMYRYDVTLDREKLLAFMQDAAHDSGTGAVVHEDAFPKQQLFGSLWIDAETFYVHRVHWKSAPTQDNELQIDFLVDFSNHNAEEPIIPPSDILPLEEGMLTIPLLFGFPSSETPQRSSSGPSADELLEDLEYTLPGS